jgi:UDP-GlcNAc:undecaprenyl-phosphate GlcNAc-1-phosphate transferase
MSPLWAVLGVSFITAVGGTLLCRKIALKTGIVDKPDDSVKTHTEPVAYLGGIGIFFGFIIGMITACFYLRTEPCFAEALKWLIGISAAGLIACLIGAVDDIHDIKPWQKIAGQLASSAALVSAGIKPSLGFITDLTGFQIHPAVEILAGFTVALIFVLGATNSLNLLDGLDGLCGGVSVVIALGMLVLAMLVKTDGAAGFGDNIRITIAFGLIGSVCGFLPFNWNPAKIFMGDAGSLFLGVIFASLMMLFAAENPLWALCSIVIFGLPILDTAVAFARRWLNKMPLFVPDRGHIYDQMMDRGIPLKRTVRMCYFMAGMYAFVGIVMSRMRISYALAIFTGVIVISGVIVWKKDFLKMEGLRGVIQKED